MHRDLDEKLAKENGSFHVPESGHVLYLDIGNDVKGPTVILHETDPAVGVENASVFTQISVVPAVVGRLLRFNGSLMHSVPRPTLLYLPHIETEKDQPIKVLVDESKHQCPMSYRRSVLLFNTWPDGPPKGITHNAPGNAVASFNAFKNEETVSNRSVEELEPTPSVLQLRTNVADLGICQPIENWIKHVEITEQSVTLADQLNNLSIDSQNLINTDNKVDCCQNQQILLKIPLLGDSHRRERIESHIMFLCSANIEAALMHTSQPATFVITEVHDAK